MSYRIENDETPAAGIRRLVGEQLEKALAELRDGERPTAWRVHQLRKRCKKLRAAVRLARPGLPVYAEANRRYRDLARQLSDHRDARVLYELVEELAEGTDAEDAASSPLIEWYAVRCRLAEAHAREILPALEAPLVRALADVRSWPLADVDEKAIGKGLEKTLRRARKGFARARRKPRAEVFHAWRKRAKYHWLHLRIMRAREGDTGQLRRDQADALADALGDAHDRSVLLAELAEAPSWLRRPAATQRVVARAHRERRALWHDALERGELLFSTGSTGIVMSA